MFPIPVPLGTWSQVTILLDILIWIKPDSITFILQCLLKTVILPNRCTDRNTVKEYIKCNALFLNCNLSWVIILIFRCYLKISSCVSPHYPVFFSLKHSNCFLHCTCILKYRTNIDLQGYCAFVVAKTVSGSALKCGCAFFLWSFNLFFLLKGIPIIS